MDLNFSLDSRLKSEFFWRARSLSDVEVVWKSRENPIRRAISEVVASLTASRVLEVGANCGATLWAIGQQKHYDWLVGTDSLSRVVERGQQLLASDLASPHALMCCSDMDLPFPDNSFDVVVSAATLVSIEPNRLDRVLSEMRRVSRSRFVFAEPSDQRTALAVSNWNVERGRSETYWLRRYANVVASLSSGDCLLEAKYEVADDDTGRFSIEVVRSDM